MAADARPVHASEGMQESVVVAVMQGLVRGGASRHVVAAAAAAIYRSALATANGDLGGTDDPFIEAEVHARLQAIRPSIRAQVKVAEVGGHNCHSAAGLVPPDTLVRANVAKHDFVLGKPFARLSSLELRRAQRGGRQRMQRGEVMPSIVKAGQASEVSVCEGTSSEASQECRGMESKLLGGEAVLAKFARLEARIARLEDVMEQDGLSVWLAEGGQQTKHGVEPGGGAPAGFDGGSDVAAAEDELAAVERVDPAAREVGDFEYEVMDRAEMGMPVLPLFPFPTVVVD